MLFSQRARMRSSPPTRKTSSASGTRARNSAIPATRPWARPSTSLFRIIPERQRHWDGYSLVTQTGQSRYGEGNVLSVPALRKDGTTISVEFTIAPLRNEAGRLFGMAAILRDVGKPL